MKESFYESHVFNDQNLPIIFHMDILDNNDTFMPHWHENIELLFFLDGETQVTLNAFTITARQGDFVIVNSNSIHHIKTVSGSSKYYCLIVDKKLCDDFLSLNDSFLLQNKCCDQVVGKYLDIISKEFEEKKQFYKAAVKSQAMSLMVYLYRNYLDYATPSIHTKNTKISIVKQAIGYIQKNYSKPISTEDIANELGFSKYYLCHIFKETTEYSLVKYLNLLRCMNAKKLLLTDLYNVGEVMSMCGYENLSYFTRTYKKYMGILPSKERETV